MMDLAHRSDNRKIIKRIIIRGNLILDTPTCLGSGDNDSPIDLALLRDNLNSNLALLTGSSIAGALRNYLRKFSKKDNQNDLRNDLVSKLFGDLFVYENEINIPDEQERIEKRNQDNQSSLIIDDSISTSHIQSELRDGVKIDSVTRTAEPKKKYDLELLQAGTEFPLCFELLIEKESDESSLLKGLAIALQGLEQGEISLGIKKHRGFGRCHVKEWQVWQFDLTDYQQRLDWLKFEHWQSFPDYPTHESIAQALNVSLDEKDDQREFCKIDATFTLATPLLIRSGQASSDKAPDVVHLKSRRNGELKPKPVLSGTSLAGVLRHRAEKIINTLTECKKPLVTKRIIKEIFGFVPDKKDQSEIEDIDHNNQKAKASRLIVHESVIENYTDLVQNRIAIDRFTGGTLHGALFNEQPIFPNNETSLKLNLELRNPQNHEIGLLLLLLKDLWTSDLPVGGTSSIGRGRLQGENATITLRREEKTETFTIEKSSDNLVVSDAKSLQEFVSALNEEVNK
ncbi:MAG: RAMP superfamily CRISPR-associated protein [Aphanizomenon gracile PMC649.10]|nr:RAMP superfamily CRISPR-associated protein [Aphanizomenon gracile PMC649.10]